MKQIRIALLLMFLGNFFCSIAFGQIDPEMRKQACIAWLNSYNKKANYKADANEDLTAVTLKVNEPTNGNIDTSTVSAQIDSMILQMEASIGPDEMINFNNSEISLPTILLESSLKGMSFCNISNANVQVLSMKGNDGKEVLLQQLNPKQFQSMYNQGLLQMDPPYPTRCSFERKVFLGTALTEEVNYSLNGIAMADLPIKMESISFDANEVGKTKIISSSKMTLLEFKDNRIAMRVENIPNVEIKSTEMMAFQKPGFAYSGKKSASCGYETYMAFKEKNFAPTEEEIPKIAETIKEGWQNDMVTVIFYPGPISKVFFYRELDRKVFIRKFKFEFQN